jgi:hypothetical protein
MKLVHQEFVGRLAVNTVLTKTLAREMLCVVRYDCVCIAANSSRHHMPVIGVRDARNYFDQILRNIYTGFWESLSHLRKPPLYLNW